MSERGKIKEWWHYCKRGYAWPGTWIKPLYIDFVMGLAESWRLIWRWAPLATAVILIDKVIG